MPMTVLLVLAILATGEGGARPSVVPDLVPPLRVVQAVSYGDFGTEMAEIGDATGKTLFVGFCRGNRGENPLDVVPGWIPPHCFVGAPHPDEPGAVLLPLWGDDERKMVRLLLAAIETRLSPEEKRKLLSDPLPGDETFSRRLGFMRGILRTAEARRLTLEAIDTGEVESSRTTLRYYGAERPLTLGPISGGDEGSPLTFTVKEAGGKSWEIFVAQNAEFREPNASSNGLGDGFPAGDIHDRYILTLATIALADTEATPDPLRSKLEEVLARRKQKTLLADSQR